MFVRKLYYDAQTGTVVRSSMMQGHVRLTSKAEDMAALPELAAYAEAPENLGVMVWTEPDAQVEDCMSQATKITVDVTVTPHQIVYDFTPLPEPEPQPSDATWVLDQLEGVSDSAEEEET